MDKTEFIFNPDAYRCATPVQIRFNDIDILGHLNNTVYFSLFDTGKAEYLQQVMKGKMDWQRVESVIANINSWFVNSCFYGEKLSVYTRCDERSEKSFRLHQMLVNPDTMQVKAVCDTVMVSYDPDRKISVPLSGLACANLDEFEGHNLHTPKPNHEN